MTPAVVIRPIREATLSVNQRLPSEPTVIKKGWVLADGTGNSLIAPLVEIRPIRSAASVNQRFLSGPATIPRGELPSDGSGNSVITPAVVIFAILFPRPSVNQMFPSGPPVMPKGSLA